MISNLEGSFMGKLRRIDEENVRMGTFRHVETSVSRKEEIDIYRADDIPCGPLEIRVYLGEEPAIARRDPMMVYQDIRIVDPEGRDIRITGEDGRTLDEEMTEVLAWEIIEYETLAETYIYGREPGKTRSPSTPSGDLDFSI
jgi:hypothetical protein